MRVSINPTNSVDKLIVVILTKTEQLCHQETYSLTFFAFIRSPITPQQKTTNTTTTTKPIQRNPKK